MDDVFAGMLTALDAGPGPVSLDWLLARLLDHPGIAETQDRLMAGEPVAIGGACGGGGAILAMGSGDGLGERPLSLVPVPEEMGRSGGRTNPVLECLSQGVMAFDRDLRLIAWNHRVLDLLSMDHAFPRFHMPYEQVVRHIALRGGYGPGDVEHLVAQRLDYITKAAWPFYNERTRPDGMVIETVTLALEGGGFVTTYTDITQRKRVERELASSRELFELAIRAAREGISEWDLRTGAVRFSPQWWGLLGYSGSESADGLDRWRDLIHPDDREPALALVEEFAAGHRTEGRQLQRFRHRAGHTVYLDTRTIGVAGSDGRPVRIVGAHTDVTETVVAAEAVRAAKEEAEQTLRELKDAQATLIQSEKMAALGSLVAGVTHELATPMGIALTGATLLAERTRAMYRLFQAGTLRKPEFAEFAETAGEATQLMMLNMERATRLVQSFKQVAVDQASEERRRFGLAEYVQEVLRSLSLRLKRSGHQVLVDCPEDLEVDGFPGALSQVLTNFVMNSIIHGYEPDRRGTLRIQIRQLAGAFRDEVELIYADDGRGIPEALHGRVFEPFFTTRRGDGGSGLGLNIVYTIATRTLRGSIRLDSGEGKGVRFTLRFPRVMPEGSLLPG